MKIFKAVATITLTTLLFGGSLTQAMAKDEMKKISGSSAVIQEIAAFPKNRIPSPLLNDALAIAIIPGAKKNDFMVSGRHASGILLQHDKDGTWHSPVFITLSGGTLGWQMVGEPMDIILLFKNKATIDGIMKAKFTMGSKVSMLPGPEGLSIKAATKEELQAEINTYVLHRKRFAEVTLTGSTIQIDNAANAAFYGKKGIQAEDILSGKVETSSAEVKNLHKVLAEYAAKQ
jgi:lipid-binding SYLF domain-containing protein